MLRRQKHVLSQSTTPFACTLLKKDCAMRGLGLGARPGTGVFRARSVPESVRQGVPENGGVSNGVSYGVSQGPFWPCCRTLSGTPRETLRRTPPTLEDTLSDTFRDTSGPNGPQDSCAWSASSQVSDSLPP